MRVRVRVRRVPRVSVRVGSGYLLGLDRRVLGLAVQRGLLGLGLGVRARARVRVRGQG